MPAKKKSSMVTMPKSWLIAAALVLGTVVVAQAVNSNKSQPNINEVKMNSAQEGTYTGTVNREVNDKDKERYTLTTDAGAKYILIGLKKDYEKPEDKVKREKEEKEKGKPSAKPSPKADKEDVESFEQYVGKKVTITGMVVPVKSDDDKVMASKEPKADKAGKSPNGNKPSMSPKANKPELSPKASKMPEDKETGAWEYDRLVVKDLSIVQ